MRANIILLTATILWGVWGWADKNAVARAHPFTIQWMYSIPYIIFIPLWYWLGAKMAPATNLDSGAFFWAISASIVSMVAAILLLFALQLKPASIAVSITSGYPVITLILSVLSGSEGFSWQKLIGILFVFIGLVILQIGQ